MAVISNFEIDVQGINLCVIWKEDKKFDETIEGLACSKRPSRDLRVRRDHRGTLSNRMRVVAATNSGNITYCAAMPIRVLSKQTWNNRAKRGNSYILVSIGNLARHKSNCNFLIFRIFCYLCWM